MDLEEGASQVANRVNVGNLLKAAHSPVSARCDINA